jgi:hypothetical protein
MAREFRNRRAAGSPSIDAAVVAVATLWAALLVLLTAVWASCTMKGGAVIGDPQGRADERALRAQECAAITGQADVCQGLLAAATSTGDPALREVFAAAHQQCVDAFDSAHRACLAQEVGTAVEACETVLAAEDACFDLLTAAQAGTGAAREQLLAQFQICFAALEREVRDCLAAGVGGTPTADADAGVPVAPAGAADCGELLCASSVCELHARAARNSQDPALQRELLSGVAQCATALGAAHASCQQSGQCTAPVDDPCTALVMAKGRATDPADARNLSAAAAQCARKVEAAVSGCAGAAAGAAGDPDDVGTDDDVDQGVDEGVDEGTGRDGR